MGFVCQGTLLQQLVAYMYIFVKVMLLCLKYYPVYYQMKHVHRPPWCTRAAPSSFRKRFHTNVRCFVVTE